uniref:Uncharacterized protein n=1 Tax=Oryza glumipatula TaxID=40148 RepID=A0A0E0BHJ1_9ORYZ
MEVGSLLCSALLAGRPLATGGEEEEEKREWNREELTIPRGERVLPPGTWYHVPEQCDTSSLASLLCSQSSTAQAGT